MNTVPDEDTIEVIGARSHNLKDISLTIPRNKLVVITGLSGSGKALAGFWYHLCRRAAPLHRKLFVIRPAVLGNMERPDVDKISGLSPVISIEQKPSTKSARSTVGTITEIYDFMRLLFARAGEVLLLQHRRKKWCVTAMSRLLTWLFKVI